MPKFIPGLELNKLFYEQVVKQLFAENFPNLKYSAARLGLGSDVLGFDTPTSTDHNWGPHLEIFLSQEDFDTYKDQVDEMLRNNLPTTFIGFSTNFTPPQHSYLERRPVYTESGPVNHLFLFYTIRSFFEEHIHFDPYQSVTIEDWLTFPQQGLLEVTAGAVYHDGLNELNATCAKFTYYPKDVWLYMMKMQWGKMADELSYQARSGEARDELGSRVIAARMVEFMMKLCFLIERKYFPYSKWFGTAFAHLNCAKQMQPLLLSILQSDDWQERQQLIAEAQSRLGEMHNALHITEPQSTELAEFPGRHYKVLDVSQYISTLSDVIQDKKLKELHYQLGSVDQFINHARINHVGDVTKQMKCIIR